MSDSLSRLMTHLIPHVLRRLSAALLLTTAIGTAALAQSLPDISPDQIADDVERRYDERTGETEYVAASFDPFENEALLAGSAHLRSASEALTIGGEFVEDGAFLDISVMYTANSADSFDVRGFEQVDYLSGQAAGIIRYDRKTLDCSRSTNAITYNDDYYRGASYGYIAGLYRIFPRYRGHRNYGWTRSSWNRGLWGDWRRRSPGYNRHIIGNPGPRGRYNAGRRHHDDDARPSRRHRTNTDRSRDHRGGNSDGVRGNGPRRNGAAPRPRRNEDTRTRGPRRDGASTRPRTRDLDASNGDRNRRVREARPNTPRATATSRPPRVRTPRAETPRNNSPKVPRNRPAVQTVKTPPPPKSRPNRPARTERPAPTRTERPTRTKTPTRTNRATDRTFKSSNPRNDNGKAHRRFFPMVGGYGYAHTDVVVSYRCVKEERLTVHIPQERLDAARFDGLTVMMVDNAGRETPVFVPPNYVEGFNRAAYQQDAAYDDYSSGRYRIEPQTQYKAPTTPPSNQPIIYGDPGYPQ